MDTNNRLKKYLLRGKNTYLKVNPDSFKNENDILDYTARELNNGVDIIELDTKNICAGEIIKLSSKIKLLCAEYDAVFIIKNRADIAFAVCADGILLGQNELCIHTAEEILPPNTLIGVETSDITDNNADFVVQKTDKTKLKNIQTNEKPFFK